MKGTINRLSRALMALVLMFSVYTSRITMNVDAAYGDIPETTIFESDDDSTSLELLGVSTNTHTRPYMLWVQESAVFIAIRSTHIIQDMTVGTPAVPYLDMYELSELTKISIDSSTNLDPSVGLQGNLGDAHWTIVSFPLSIIQESGVYYFYIHGIGGGHDVRSEYSVIVPRVTVNVEKTWVNGPMSSIDVRFLRHIEGGEPELATAPDGLPISNPVTLTPNAEGKATYTWAELPITNNIGKVYEYDVVEDDPGLGYHVTTDSKTYNSETKTYYFKLTNTYTQPRSDITARKVWVGGAVRVPVEFILYRQIVGTETIEEVEHITLDGIVDSDGELAPWVYTWTNYPTRSLGGLEYDYFVEEVTEVPNYTATVSTDGLTITNTYVSPLISITGTKVWVNGPTPRPNVEVQLYRDDEAVGEPVVFADGTTTHTWSGLPKTNEFGVDHVYTIDEVTVPTSYIKTLSNDKLTITNTYQTPTRDITVTKVWVNGPTEPPTIEVQLYRDDEAVGEPIEMVTGTTTHTWTDLPTTNDEGTAYVYTVDEVTVPANYEKVVDNGTFTITNTFVTPLITISGTKTWIDDNNSAGLRPEEITLILYANEIAVERYEINWVKDGNAWGYEIINLPQYLDGEEVVYTILEEAVPDYEATYVGFDIINTLKDLPEVLPGERPDPLPTTGIENNYIGYGLLGLGLLFLTVGQSLKKIRKES